jgi:membrane protease YdiL (CAAX protease family)
MLSVKPWKPEPVARMFLGLFGSIMFGAVLSGFVLGKHGSGVAGQVSFVAIAISALTFHGVAMVLLRFLLWEHDTNLANAFGLRREGLGKAIGFGLLIGFLAVFMATFLAEITSRIMLYFGYKPTMQQAVELLSNAAQTPFYEIAGIGFLAVIVAPLVEESIFRGVLYPTIKQAGMPKLALWGTSLFFAVTHANVMAMVPLTLFAVILAWLYERYDNLAAPIAAHSIFNLVNFSYVVLFSGDPAATGFLW